MRCRGSDPPRAAMRSGAFVDRDTRGAQRHLKPHDTLALAMIGFGLLILVAPTSVPGLMPPVSM